MKRNFEFEPVDYNPFGEKEIIRVSRLTDAQREIWLSCVLGGDEANLSYNESVSLKFSGDLNKEYLWEACDYLVERHESLRMTFSPDGNSFMVYNQLEPLKFEKDFSSFIEKRRKSAIEEFLDQEASFVFDIKNGPLIRFSLIQLSKETFLFTITAHHLVADGWSFGVMLEEIASVYNALLAKKPIALPEVTQFSQYAGEMASFSDSKEYQSTEKYWLGKYKLVPEPLELPTDRPRPIQRTFNSRREDFELPAELVGQIKELGKKTKSSLVSTIMAVFEIFLSKITGQDDIVLGLPTAGQAATGHLVLVGHCVNLLPIRTNVDQNLSFEEYLRKRRSELLDDYDHQKYTFGNLLKNLNIKRDASRIPLVPVVFNIDMGMDNLVDFLGVDFELISNPRKYENFDFSLNIINKGVDLIFEWSYKTDLFERETLREWMKSFQDLVNFVYQNPQSRILDWQYKPIKSSNRSIVGKPHNLNLKKSFLEVFDEIVKNKGENIAVVTPTKKYTYKDLDNYSNLLSSFLNNRGVNRGDVIGVYLSRNQNLLVTFLGILKAGACFLAVDKNQPKERLKYFVESSEIKLIISEEKESLNFLDSVNIYAINEIFAKKAAFTERIDIARNYPLSDDPAYLLFTSGSTGKPKGVLVTHKNLLNFLIGISEEIGVKEYDCFLGVTTVSFDISIFELFTPLINGASVFLAEDSPFIDGKRFWQTIADFGITVVQATPSAWKLLFSSGYKPYLKLKILTGGEPISSEIANKLIDSFGSFWFGYGPTETTVVSTIKHVTDPEKITVGLPLCNTQVVILDQKNKFLPKGSTGEIAIGGLGVSKGYYNFPKATGNSFIDLPNQDTLFYKTGDYGKIEENDELTCLGRKDSQVKIRGYRIELSEIEYAINKLPEVMQSAVVVQDGFGQNKNITAFLVLDNSDKKNSKDSLKIADYKQLLGDKLPQYMIPNEWIILLEMPLTPNQKIDKLMLASIGNAQAKLDKIEGDENQSLIQQIMNVWIEALGHEQFTEDDDFFEIGGHSLLAIDVISNMEKKLAMEISINTIFKYPTVKSLAAFLDSENQKNDDWSCLVPIKPNGTKPPLYIIHGVGCSVTSYYALGERMPEDIPLYGFQVKGLNGIDEPHHSLEEMAGHYLDLMLEHNPHGPYFISGYSFGGYVAYEMARQMLSKGILNFKLILFDTAVWKRKDELTLKGKIVQEIGKRVAELRLFYQYPTYFMKNKKEAAQRIMEKKFSLKLQDKEQLSDRRLLIKDLTKNNEKILNKYAIEEISHELYLFKVELPDFYTKGMDNYGWAEFVEKVIVFPISGHHNIIFKDKRVMEELVEKIQIILNN